MDATTHCTRTRTGKSEIQLFQATLRYQCHVIGSGIFLLPQRFIRDLSCLSSSQRLELPSVILLAVCQKLLVILIMGGAFHIPKQPLETLLYFNVGFLGWAVIAWAVMQQSICKTLSSLLKPWTYEPFASVSLIILLSFDEYIWS